MLSLILTILGFILPLIEDWYTNSKKEPTYAQDKQRFNKALIAHNADNLSSLFEQLRVPGVECNSNPGRPDDKETPRRELRSNPGLAPGQVYPGKVSEAGTQKMQGVEHD